MMIKIAFIGNSGSGKTTAASYLEEIYGFAVVSFADKLKMNLIDIGVDPYVLYDNRTYLSRSLMQLYGEQMREQDTDHWVKEVVGTVADFEESPHFEGVAIDDLRFHNEVDALREQGFVVVRVLKVGAEAAGMIVNHVSEMEQLGIHEDYILSASTGDMVSLYGEIDDLVAVLEDKCDAP